MQPHESPTAPSAITVRRAEPDDAAAIAGLLKQLGYPCDAGTAERRLPPDDSVQTVAVACEADGRVVGWIEVPSVACP